VGTVHQLLRGQPGVTIGVEPKTSSLIEGMETETHKAFLGVVVAVQPDGTITVQSVGRVNAGEFRVEHFTRTAWREFRPVFISFS
jgi:hypothetical protein